MDDNERAVQRIHQMCCTIEALGQELQDAQAKIKRLREALEAVEWVTDNVDRQPHETGSYCPWCIGSHPGYTDNDHKPDCQRQAALEGADDA
jgi:hypothetical protein